MQIGRSKFTIGFLLAFLVGLFLARFFNISFLVLGIFLSLTLVWLYLFWDRITFRLSLFCFLGLFLGLGYYYFYNNWQNRHTLNYQTKQEIEGQIVELPQIKPTKIQVVLKYGKTKILVNLPRYPEYNYGDTLKFEGIIENPAEIKSFDGFDYGQYLLDKNIRGLVNNPEKITAHVPNGCTKWSCLEYSFLKIIYSVGQKFQESLSRILPEPYASFQAGLILGNRTTQIPDSLTSTFNRTGTTHVVAVSGYNITIIISILALCFALFSRRAAFWATLISISIFIIMTGGSASVVRAGILGGLAAWGKLEGRRVNYLILILATAFAMLLLNPYQIHGDIGFQLSFLAFAGIVYIAPIIDNLKIMAILPSILKNILAETLGAQIAVLPIIIYNFGLVSLVAPIVNILILPVVPLAMFLGFVAGLGGLIWAELGQILAYPSWLVLKYIILVVESAAKIPWAAIVLKTKEWWWIPIYYVVIIYLIQNKKLAKQNE